MKNMIKGFTEVVKNLDEKDKRQVAFFGCLAGGAVIVLCMHRGKLYATETSEFLKTARAVLNHI